MPDIDRVIAGLRCRDLLPKLPDYVDGELSTEDVGRVDAHLQGCEHCAKFGGEYGALVMELKSHLEPPAVDLDIRTRLANRMEEVWASENE